MDSLRWDSLVLWIIDPDYPSGYRLDKEHERRVLRGSHGQCRTSGSRIGRIVLCWIQSDHCIPSFTGVGLETGLSGRCIGKEKRGQTYERRLRSLEVVSFSDATLCLIYCGALCCLLWKRLKEGETGSWKNC